MTLLIPARFRAPLCRTSGFALALFSCANACSSWAGSDAATGGSSGVAGTSAGGGSAGTGTASGGSSSQAGGAATVHWVGRVDLSGPAAPKFAWSGTGFIANVSGTAITVKLSTAGSTDPVFFQPVIDGTPGARFSIANGEQAVALGTGLSDGPHRVEVYRENEGKFGDTVFGGFTDGTLEAPPADSGRLIEIVGDSISAGYGDLGSEQHPNYGADPTGGCHFSTETESAYMTYGAVAARQLGADASILALSGWGAYRDNSNNMANVLGSVYANTLGTQATPSWSFQPAPQAVVINLGTNDFSMGDPGADAFKGAYSALVATIRGKYPDAWIFCMIGPLLYGTGLDAATADITDLVTASQASGDARIQLYNFGQQNSSLGTGCDYHPNVTVQAAMGQVLATKVKTALGW